jgi:hypothetical protein
MAIDNLNLGFAGRRLWVASASILFLGSAFITRAQQPPSTLQITSPVNGSIVNQGQTITVTVSSTTGSTATQVAIFGESPLGNTFVSGSLPAQLNITIPADAPSRKYSLTASAVTTSGSDAKSDPILVDVERPDLPISLTTPLAGVYMEAPPRRFPLALLATFSDGSVLDVSESTFVSYTSDNPLSGSVAADGVVTALAPGGGSIHATYAISAGNLSISVPFAVLSSGSTQNSFTVSASPSTQAVVGGNTATYTVQVTPVSGFSGDVTLDLGGLVGVSGTFSPAVVTEASGSSSLTVSVSSSVPGGTYPLNIKGLSGSAYADAQVQLTITPSILIAPRLDPKN